MSEPQVRVVLPEPVLHAMRAVAGDRDLSEADRATAVIVTAMGGAWYAAQETIDGRRWAIPSSQWQEIAALLLQLSMSDLDGVTWALTWMNKGLSAYGDADEDADEQV
jgi:hypothetical protein